MPVVPGGAEDTLARIERLLRTQEPQIRAAFMLAVREIRNSQTLEQLAALIERGQLEVFLNAVRPAAELLAVSYGTVVTNAAVDTAEFLTRDALTNSVAFDRARTRVVSVLQQEQLRLIRIFDQEQRTVIRQTLQQGFIDGLNPVESAREIREVVGLTPRQEQTVQNFRALLTKRQDGTPSREVMRRALRDGRFDRTVERAIREGRPLTAAQIDRMTTRYRERLVNFHARVVARTESLSAIHQGNELMYRQGIDDGQFDTDQLVRIWRTARDERVRSSHRALNGVPKGFEETEVWQTANGPLRFPGDPQASLSETAQCRCVVTVRIREPEPAPA